MYLKFVVILRERTRRFKWNIPGSLLFTIRKVSTRESPFTWQRDVCNFLPSLSPFPFPYIQKVNKLDL